MVQAGYTLQGVGRFVNAEGGGEALDELFDRLEEREIASFVYLFHLLMTLTVVCAVGAGFLFYLQGDAGGGHVEMMQGQPKRAAAPAPAEAPPTSGALV